MVLRSGRLAFDGDVPTPSQSIRRGRAQLSSAILRDRHDRAGKGEIRSTSIALRGADGELTRAVRPYEPFDIRGVLRGEGAAARGRRQRQHRDAGRRRARDVVQRVQERKLQRRGRHWNVRVPCCGLPLRPDTYTIDVFLGGNHAFYDHVERAVSFDIAPHDVYGTGRLPQWNEGPLRGELSLAGRGRAIVKAVS